MELLKENLYIIGSITKRVGEKMYFTRLPFLGHQCGVCGAIYEYHPILYCGIEPEISNVQTIGNINYEVGHKQSDYSTNSYECLRAIFDIIMPGKTTIKLSYYVNFKIKGKSGYCSSCKRNYIIIPSDNNWYSFVDTFNIISTVDYNLIYDANSDKEDVFNMPESESKKNSSEEKYKFKINEKIPVRDGYEFLGWAEEKDQKKVKYKSGENITVEWKSGNNVEKTLYAVWRKHDLDEYDVKIKLNIEKIWEDNENKAGNRPDSVTVELYGNDVLIDEIVLNSKNNWSSEIEVLKYNELGEEIVYTIDEKETSKYYEKIVDGYKIINKYITNDDKTEDNYENIEDNDNIENVDTSDINIYVYVSIFIVAIIITIMFIILSIKTRLKNNE